MIAWLGKALLGKLILAAVIAAVAGGGYLFVTERAFNRGYDKGVAETTAHMKAAIAKQKKAVADDMARLRRLSPDDLDKAIERHCREAGGGDACAR